MTKFINKEKLLQIKVDSKYLDELIVSLNQNITSSQRNGFSSYTWEAYTLTKAKEEDDEVSIQNINKTIINMVVKQLIDSGYDTKVFESDSGNLTKVEINWGEPTAPSAHTRRRP
jgi:hypothetical protein